MLGWDVFGVCPLKQGVESHLAGLASLFPAFLVVLRALPKVVCLCQARRELQLAYRTIGLTVLHMRTECRMDDAGAVADRD